LLSPRLDAPVPPVNSTKPCRHDAAPTRRRASKTLRHSYTRDLPDTQREMIPSRIPPQRSGGDRRLPDPRDAFQAMFSVTQNGGTGDTPQAPRGRKPRQGSFSGLLNTYTHQHPPCRISLGDEIRRSTPNIGAEALSSQKCRGNPSILLPHPLNLGFGFRIIRLHKNRCLCLLPDGLRGIRRDRPHRVRCPDL